MLHRVKQKLTFKNKRDYLLITPCCNKENKDGKFVNYKGFANIYGYCHSCGKSTNPPSTYLDENGNTHNWNTVTQKFESVSQTSYNNVLQDGEIRNTKYYNQLNPEAKQSKLIDYKLVIGFKTIFPENNLLQYLRNTYEKEKVDFVKQLYCIGTSKNAGTIFWSINKEGEAQKAKVSYYTKNGKRTDRFEVPYKNSEGYFGCLYGEHLLKDNRKPIILVESEKTAIVASIEFPEYTWLAYSGINGLTDAKLRVLENERIIIIPDMSQNAVAIMNKKLSKLRSLNIDATIYDITLGKTDEQLKIEGLYNCDLEDILRVS